MAIPILLPDLGTPLATVSLWFIELGGRVDAGESVLEILAGPATIGIEAPVGGRLIERRATPAERVLPGQVLGYIEEDSVGY